MKRNIKRGCGIVWLFMMPMAGAAVTVEEVIQSALDQSPECQVAEARIQESRAMLRQARSHYYPNVGLSVNYTVTDNPPQAFMMTLNQRDLNMMAPGFDPNDPGSTDNLRVSIGLKWRVFDTQREAGYRMAGFADRMREQMLAATRNQLVHEVTRGFYSILQAKAFCDVHRESLLSIEESLRIARERLNAGSAVRTDVLNLETQLAQAQEALIRANNGVELAVAALNAAIGIELVTSDSITEPDVGPVLDSPPPDCTNPEAYRARPELLAAHLLQSVRKAALARARASYMPTLSAFASYDVDHDLSRGSEESTMAGVMAELMVFDGAGRRASVQAAHAGVLVADAEVRQAMLQLRLDLKQAFLATGEAWERLGVIHKSLQTAVEAQRIVQEQYQQGAADVALLLQTQVNVTMMKTHAVAARYDALTALSNLKRAKGEYVNYKEERP